MYRFLPVANYPRPNSPGGSGEREGKGEKGRTIPSLGIVHLSIYSIYLSICLSIWKGKEKGIG